MTTPSSQQWKRTTDLNINLQQILEQMALTPDPKPTSDVDRFLLNIDLPTSPERKQERKRQ
jgi:hypothetical protein